MNCIMRTKRTLSRAREWISAGYLQIFEIYEIREEADLLTFHLKVQVKFEWTFSWESKMWTEPSREPAAILLPLRFHALQWTPSSIDTIVFPADFAMVWNRCMFLLRLRMQISYQFQHKFS